MRPLFPLSRLVSAIALLFTLCHVPSSYAVPSFARQTGLQCSGCHTAFPQLNAFGRLFKLQGYTMTGGNPGKADNNGFSNLSTVPLSMMIQATINRIDTAPDENTSTTDVKFPSQLSIFYAGRIADNVGAFVQITAEDGGSFSQDNTDIRYGDQTLLSGHSLLYGVSVNNNPTVQDPWNSTPTWSFPWFEAGYGYGSPDTMLSSLGGAVAGATVFGFWDNHVYAEAGAYHAANTGADLSAEALGNTAPYWRLAYTANAGNLNWMVGTFGLAGDVYDGLNRAASITDTGIDTQLQWTLADNQSVTLDASFIHEAQPGSQHLNSSMINATWYPVPVWGISLGYRGSLSSDHALAPDEDYRWNDAGNLDSDAFQLQLNVAHRSNTRIALQYTAYSKLNGTSDNASDSNQLMLGAWLVF